MKIHISATLCKKYVTVLHKYNSGNEKYSCPNISSLILWVAYTHSNLKILVWVSNFGIHFCAI